MNIEEKRECTRIQIEKNTRNGIHTLEVTGVATLLLSITAGKTRFGHAFRREYFSFRYTSFGLTFP